MALGADVYPLSFSFDGRIYTENYGILFAVADESRRREKHILEEPRVFEAGSNEKRKP